MLETSKHYYQRLGRGIFEKYLVGQGIDIGCGEDILRGPHCTVIPYDVQDGDAQYMENVPDSCLDFVYSSHCLEHMVDVRIALQNWIRICKPGGFLYVIVPDENLYEKGMFPSRFNSDHKWTFTIGKKTDLPKNVVLIDLLNEFRSHVDIIEIFLNDTNYDYFLPRNIDQTRMHASAQIEFILQKKV